MGLELEPPTVRRCANRCEFCFVEGLPKGLRRPLYIRDDDYRLSFAYGNFATLSNLKERDIARILEYRLSPLYVSVHATPWEARKKLLNNPRVPNILAQIKALAAGGIQFHGQMVVVPGLNDGACSNSRSPISGTWATPCSPSRSCRWGSRSSRISTRGESMDRGQRLADSCDGGEVGRAEQARARLHLGLRVRRALPALRARAAAALVLRRLSADRERRRRGDRAARTGRRGTLAPAAARRQDHRRRDRHVDGAADAAAALAARARDWRDLRADRGGEFAVRSHHNHRRPPRWRRYPARTGRSHRPGHGFDSRRNDQRKRPLPRR